MNKQAFTIIELLISIIIIGILSTLLFRTMAEMIKSNARIQQEKIIARELIGIQTSLNTITEHYNLLDTAQYLQADFDQPLDILYLKNKHWGTAKIYGTGDENCQTSCGLLAEIWSESIELTNPSLTKLDHIGFKVLPRALYQNSQYEDGFAREHISQPWFWIFWTLRNNLAPGFEPKTSHTLQHFVNLSYYEAWE